METITFDISDRTFRRLEEIAQEQETVEQEVADSSASVLWDFVGLLSKEKADRMEQDVHAIRKETTQSLNRLSVCTLMPYQLR